VSSFPVWEWRVQSPQFTIKPVVPVFSVISNQTCMQSITFSERYMVKKELGLMQQTTLGLHQTVGIYFKRQGISLNCSESQILFPVVNT
jgi:hypothetical protein